MSTGTLYGVGVGPGDPELMTVKAIRVIERCPVAAAPRTAGGGMVALDIAAGAVDLTGKTILPLDFAMHRDPEIRAASHRAAAAALRVHLDEGRDVAMLNLGDVSVYASYRYIADILRPEGYPLVMIPGVTSFCASAARLGESLTDMRSTLTIVPDSDGDDGKFLDQPGVRVFMKSGRKLPALLARIRERGLAKRAMVVQNCGMDGERVMPELGDDDPDDRYFTVVIVKAEGDGA